MRKISNDLINSVERVYDKYTYELFRGKSKDFKSLEARRVLQFHMYIAMNNYSTVARYFNITPASVRYNINVINNSSVLKLRCINIKYLPTMEQQVHDLLNIIQSKYTLSHAHYMKSQTKKHDNHLISKITAAIMIKHYAEINLTFITKTLGMGIGNSAPLLIDKEIKEKIFNYYIMDLIFKNEKPIFAT